MTANECYREWSKDSPLTASQEKRVREIVKDELSKHNAKDMFNSLAERLESLKKPTKN